MVKCNRERVKEFNSHFIATSDLEEASCEQNLVDADFLDFKTDILIFCIYSPIIRELQNLYPRG